MTRFSTNRGALAVLVLLAVVLLALPLAAQERTGNIAGVVKDPSGAVVPDVNVLIRNQDTNRTMTAKTRADGTFYAGEVEPGRYTVTFEKTGFAKTSIPDVPVQLGKTANLEPQMKIGGVETVVEVVGTGAVIDTTSTMISHNVTAEEIAALPKARNFEGIALFSPSVNTGYIEGGFQINGASGAENNYYVDGVSTNSVIDGSARQSATFDYLQEVQVKTTGLDAEYGGALGGVVTAVTRSGGNAFHGDVHYYYFGNKLNAAPGKRIAVDPSVGYAPYPMSYFQDDKGKNDNHEIGGSLGGPFIKDKLWFYTAFTPRWLQQRREYQFSDAPGSLDRSANYINWFSKVSWDPTSRIHTNFTWLYTPTYSTGSIFAYNGYGANMITRDTATALSSSILGFTQAENSLTGQVDFTLTNTSLLSVRGGRYYLNYKDTGVTADRQWVWAYSSSGLVGLPSSLQRTAGTYGASPAQTAHDLTTRAYIQADFSQLAHFAGQHNFKFGVGTTKNVNNVNDSADGPEGLITVNWGLPDPVTGLPTGRACSACVDAGGQAGTSQWGYYTVDVMGTVGSAGSNITHLYVQDSWKIHPRLTINAGLRTEKETIPSFKPEIKKIAIAFGFGEKIAPRLGASFDLLGNGKVKISGGWGRYYDWTKYDLPRGTFGGDTWWTYYRSLDDPNEVLNLGLSNMPGTNLWVEDHQDWRLPGFDTLDPNVKPMSSQSMNAGVEWEVKKDLVFTGRYVRNSLTRTIEDMGVLVNGSEQYFYGNPGEGQNTEAPSCYQRPAGGGALVPTCTIPMPKPIRNYDAMELSLARRFSRGYTFNASYTYSKLYGNYSGLQSTDEILPSAYGAFTGNQSFFGQTYRPGGNANRYFDLDQAFVDAHGNLDLLGRLPSDRPHVLKLYGSKEFKFGTGIGAFFRAQSGTPITTQVYSSNGIPIYVNGRADVGREKFLTQTDMLVSHTVKIAEGKTMRFEMNMQNLFNQKTAVFTWPFYNRRDHRSSTGMKVTGIDFRQGFDWQSVLASSGTGGVPDLDSRFGQASDYNPGFSARFMVKFTF